MRSKEKIIKEYQDSLDALKSVPGTTEAIVNATQSITLAAMLTVFIDIRDVLAAISADLDIIRDQGEH